ncbi:hypothetical protein EDC22_105231 [Tepidamorphus gemmatus]|uniref:Type IV pilus biogenesis protein PilP n=1 Tax=Tepidamorphus gemmatus TaxID=747076 RepID=A0A4R3MAX4_9HYPH|nr:hypothetical protein [Tepidamorphus gemmatus]TCT10731.1 hypothetical protein EDC22_105231 [Tepidamorphus gemmatus]
MSERRLAGIVLIALVALTATGSEAQTPTWLDEMATIDAQIQLLQKQMELDVLLEQRAAQRSSMLPSILTIVGFGDRYSVELLFPNGRIGRYRVGDEIAPEVWISAIRPRGVTVDMAIADGKRRAVALEFAAAGSDATAVATDTATAPAQSPALLQAVRPDPPAINVRAQP